MLRYSIVIALILGTLSVGYAQKPTRSQGPQASFPDSGSCSEVDLRTQTCPDGHPRMPPVRNQGETNYCFAYSLADLYSYVSCNNFSGLSTGLQANLRFMQENPNPTFNSESLDTGMPTIVANNMIRNAGGICLEADYSSYRNEIMAERSYSRFLTSIWRQRRERNPLGCRIQQVPHLDITTIERALDRSEETNAIERQTQIMDVVNTSLERNSPVIMNYNPNIIDDRFTPVNAASGHVSMIVGRKMMNGTCHFLVRDPTPVRNSAWTEDHGYVWIPRSNLIPHINEVSTAREVTPDCPEPTTP